MAKTKEIVSKSRLNRVSVPAEIGINIVLGLFCAACIVPFIFCIIISFTSEASIAKYGFSFFPKEWSVQAYEYVWALGEQLWRSYFNSFFVTIVGTIFSLAVTVLYAYALFRKDFKYRGFFVFFCFFTMLFGGGLTPTYVVCKNLLGLKDSYAAIIVPMLLNPFNVIIMRTFFQSSVPTELIESSAIDGSGEYNTLIKIILPITKPGIATVGLLTALSYWNEWFIPMLYIDNKKFIPLQLLLQRMQSQVDFLARCASQIGVEAMRIATNLPSQTLRMALVVFIVIPIACAYPFFQRYIISGLTVGSVKG